MHKLIRTVAVFALLVFAALGQPPTAARGRGGRGGGGFTAKNLQLLEPADLPSAMQSYVQALGLLDKGVCDYCHVEDRSSDERMQKLIARDMIQMVREINGRFPDGQQHVTCYTCHRGSTTPAIAP
jgi:hypothetical protein